MEKQFAALSLQALDLLQKCERDIKSQSGDDVILVAYKK